MEQRLKVLRAEDVAEILLSTPEAVIDELDARRLSGFRIGGEWRTTLQAVESFIQVGSPPQNPSRGASEGSIAFATDRPRHLVIHEHTRGWTKVGPFSHRWPKDTEEFDSGMVARLRVGQRDVPFLIGFTHRRSSGRERRRAVVFLGEPGRTLYPCVEFVGANDFDESGRMASVIKGEGSRHVRPGNPVPVAYEGLPTVVFSDIVSGPYAARSLAIEARQDDYDLMCRHALLRAQAKGYV